MFDASGVGTSLGLASPQDGRETREDLTWEIGDAYLQFLYALRAGGSGECLFEI